MMHDKIAQPIIRVVRHPAARIDYVASHRRRGCSERRTLAATPNLYQNGGGKEVFDTVPEALCTTDMDVLYATDRQVDEMTPAGPKYGRGRTDWLAFGDATVSLSPSVSWDELVADSTSAMREHDYFLTTSATREQGRFSWYNLPRVVQPDGRLASPRRGNSNRRGSRTI